MTNPNVDGRTSSRRERDEQFAAEPMLPPPNLPTSAEPSPVETHLDRIRRRPAAVVGVVEHGLVRPLDPAVKLTENARVIIITTEQS